MVEYFSYKAKYQLQYKTSKLLAETGAEMVEEFALVMLENSLYLPEQKFMATQLQRAALEYILWALEPAPLIQKQLLY